MEPNDLDPRPRRTWRNLLGSLGANAAGCVERRGDVAILDDGTAVLSA